MRSRKLRVQGPILRWDEGLPLGNGRSGCLIWGEAKALRFSLDRGDIWDRTRPHQVDSPDFTYENLIRLAKERNTEEIRRIFDAPYQASLPTRLPAGTLIFHLPEDWKMSQSLDLETAEAVILLKNGERKVQLRALCHAENGSGMIEIQTEEKGETQTEFGESGKSERGNLQFQVKLMSPSFGVRSAKEKGFSDTEEEDYDPAKRQISQGSLSSIYYPKVEYGSCQKEGISFQWFKQEVDTSFSYGIVLASARREKRKELFYRIITSKDRERGSEEIVKGSPGKVSNGSFEKALDEAVLLLLGQIKEGYDRQRKSHMRWWKRYWEKSSINLPDQEMERQWYVTNYLFASCSRKGSEPMPLQGVWTADDGCLPPWKGDYHNDLNTQLSYTHFYKADHLEEGEAFTDFLWKLRDAGREFASSFYHTDGICMPGVMTIDGRPLGGWPMYSLSPVHQIWLCRSFEQYYRYTGDEEFLSDRCWVYFRETAECITALLEEGKDGLHLPVSSSPELHDDEASAWVTPNSSYDLALLKYFYWTLVRFSNILENGEEDRWRSVADRLPDFSLDERKVLKISPDEILTESHRHLSNAMAICPMELVGYETDEEREIVDAVIADYERLGTGMWVGFSFTWMAHLYAVAGNGEGAREQLRIFWDSFCSPNGFHLNGDYRYRGYSSFHYRPFTLEANMYAADALQEMLFQMRDGICTLFPAVPEEWLIRGVKFQGFRGETGLKVSAEAKKGKLVFLELYIPYDRKRNGMEQNLQIRLSRALEEQMGDSLPRELKIKPGETFFWKKE